MRDFSTLYAGRVTGAFPDQKAIASTTATAKDGTPYKKINIDDLTIVPISALFNFLGITPDGQPEEFDASQVFNAYRKLSDYVVPETVNATQTLDLAGFSRLFEADTSLMDITLTVPDPDYAGQKCIITPIDDGICYVRGSGTIDADGYKSGIYDGNGNTGLYVTKNHKAELIGVEKGGVLVWQVTVEETADFIDGTERIVMKSSGRMKSIYEDTLVFISATSIGVDITYSIPFASIDGRIQSIGDTSGISATEYSLTNLRRTSDALTGTSLLLASNNTVVSGDTADATLVTEGRF